MNGSNQTFPARLLFYIVGQNMFDFKLRYFVGKVYRKKNIDERVMLTDRKEEHPNLPSLVLSSPEHSLKSL